MKLDAWQRHLAVAALEEFAEAKRRKGERAKTHIADESAGRAYKATSAESTEAFLECAALEAVVRALETGEALEVGP